MFTLRKTLSGVKARRAVLLLPAVLAGALVSVFPLTANAVDVVTVPAATLTQVNVPGTSPMSATAVDLGAAGYTAKEFYAEGLANRYTGADANTFTTATVLDGGNPYRTRVMVRYPKPHKFNGTLAVEWTNVTIGVDFEFATAEASEYLLREGYAVAQYAQRIISSPGKQDGLAWQNADGTWAGPIGENIAKAIKEGLVPYHGYFFKILTGQGPAARLGQMDYVINGVMIGGFALVASPAEYGVTGFKTFLVSYDGIVYQKDLGTKSNALFQKMERYDPDKTWQVVPDDQ
jgi:hypothetical protein